MKTYVKLIVLFAVIGVLLAGFLLFRQASAPESAIIAREKEKLSASLDKGRMEKDPVYAFEMQDRLQFLDFQMAVAYNKENKPDKAVPVLEKLISDEQAKNKGDIPRRSRSYQAEASYYEALQESCSLKHDQAGEERAINRRAQLRASAEQAKRRERAEEGKSVGASGE